MVYNLLFLLNVFEKEHYKLIRKDRNPNEFNEIIIITSTFHILLVVSFLYEGKLPFKS